MLSPLLLALAPLLSAPTEPAEDPRAELLRGVESIASPGNPGGVTVFGPDAWPLVMGGHAPIAAARPAC